MTQHSSLNQQQLEAIEALEGPLLVLAGAGTGKTRVLTHRLVKLIEAGIAPEQIMALTFTNKAAKEMMNRTYDMIGDSARGIWLGTFHSIGARMMRRYADRFGLNNDFTIINSDDQKRLLKNIVAEMNLDPEEYSDKLLAHILNNHKDLAQNPVTAEEGIARDIFRTYEQQMRSMNAADFGDLLYRNIALWQKNEEMLSYWQERFQYILVDEYQDTNHTQYLFLKMLAAKNKNLACVGDDDQSIYGWRGADIRNILSFQKDYPEAKVIRLEQNYRSTDTILHCANRVISHNQGRLGKNLFTPKKSSNKVLVRECFDSDMEADLITRAIRQYHDKGQDYRAMAVLVRTSAQTRVLETRFNHFGIPYQVVGGAKFYDREEIRDALAYLRLIHSHQDDLAFRRIINRPKRGIGQAGLDKLADIAREKNQSLYETLALRVRQGEEKSERLKSFVTRMDGFAYQLHNEENINLADLTSAMMIQLGYIDMLKNHKEKLTGETKIDNLKELYLAMSPYPTLAIFLEEVSLATDNDDKNQTDHDKVSLMTIHAAKGLEFPIVFLSGWEEGLFPSPRTINEEGQKGLEEERRLAYVAITRAMEHLIISYARRRRLYGNSWQDQPPSRFLKELERSMVLWQKADGRFIDDAQMTQLMKNAQVADRQDGDYQPIRYAHYRKPNINHYQQATPAHPKTNSHDNLMGRMVRHPRFGLGKVTDIKNDVFIIHFHDDKTRSVLKDYINVVAINK